MAIGDTISQPIPAVSTPGSGYASQIVAFLTEVKTRLQAKVPFSSLLIAALDMANNAISNLAYATFYPQAATPPTNSLYNSGGNLWYVSSGGAFQMTNGNQLNLASLGGITGDYGGANPARFKYVSADQEYYAYANEGTGNWAKVWAQNFDIAAGATSSSRLRLAFGGTSYTLTLPAAVPGTQGLIQMTPGGALVTDNGNINGLTFLSGTHITLSGTGDIKHGARRKVIDLSPVGVTSGSTSFSSGTGGTQAAAGTVYYAALSRHFNIGDRITAATFQVNNTGGVTVTYELLAINSSGGITVVATVSGTGAVTWTTGLPWTMSPSFVNYVRVTTSAGGNCTMLYADVTWDRP